MTLLVGLSAFGIHGAILSDTRVSFDGGQSRDMVRKAYAIGNWLAAGFAGSVQIGFALVQNLRQNLELPPSKRSAIWPPAALLREWAPIASEIFRRAPANVQALGSSILIVAFDPQHREIRLFRLDSPAFQPKFERRGLRMLSVGSGATDRGFLSLIRPHVDPRSTPAQLLQGGVGFWAASLADSLYQSALAKERVSVGRHFHVLGVSHGTFTEASSGRKAFVDWQDEPIDLDPMPAVANSYEEFLAMARDAGIGASALGSC